ncbi:uncharacterized protein LOC128859749 [Anastrepha ludens]|uniref:uncharacterized protein LOC128859749 n=1 Tax=Anastrepha ludens TaxID=28586 RepID=UPI0023AEC767|nr:uncharacterized protein LOC128859749 [Anastrepha ludens]
MSTVKECNALSEDQEHSQKPKCEDSNDSGSAKIISNELLLVGMYSGVEKIDELTSLEREIAELHHVEPSTNVEYHVSDNFNNGNGVINKQMLSSGKTSGMKSKHTSLKILDSINREECVTFLHCDSVDEDNIIPQEIGSTALEHEDLIAVLKGIDDHNNVTNVKEVTNANHEEQCMRPPSITESELVEGVTIEGEGQFQIMEVVYDEVDENDSKPKEAQDDPSIQAATSNPMPSSGPNAISHLTNEEIRAMAMEQIAGLNVLGRQRRRKQDIKPLQAEDSSDLVASIGADWSDDDAEFELKATSSVSNSQKSNFNIELKNKKRDFETEVLERKELVNNNTNDSIQKATGVVKLDEVCSDNSHGESTIIPGESVKNDAISIKPIVGFKRTRIIKRKIIWDPDAPETQISYAQLARNNSKLNLDADNKTSKVSSGSTLKGVRSDVTKNQQSELKGKKSPISASNAHRQSESESKQQLRGSEFKIGSSSVVSKTKETVSISPTDIQSKRSKIVDEENMMKCQPAIKRRSLTPVINGTGGNTGSKKKRGSEIDRLVSDEGAANMLHSLENERSKLIAEQGADKPHKPLMRSRAATISERISKRETTPTSGKVLAVAASTGGARNKRNSKQKPSSTWDYVYKQQASEEAMIIRRRSNSSYSSNASIRRTSLDAPATKTSNATKTTTFAKSVQHNASSGAAVSATPSSSGTKTTQKSLLKTSNENSASVKGSAVNIIGKNPTCAVSSFQFAKPELKANQKSNRRTKGNSHVESFPTNDTKKQTLASGVRRGERSPTTIDEKDKNKNTGVSNKISAKQPKEESPVGSIISDVVVKKVTKVAQIVFNTQKAKINYTFTAQMLNKLVDILEKLSKDAECNAVVITTDAPNFCYGVDFTDLTLGPMEKRKQTAVHLALAVKNYLKMLATFPKPLIAGVNGSNIGLGVMQLPLFDIVIGSDKGSYETPYVKIGQVPEGYCIWNKITKIRDNYKTKLFWLGEKLHSTESALSGLVHKLTASAKVNDDALLAAKKIAMMSTESYRCMKKTVIDNHFEIINNALDEEFETIVEQWISAECYENFKKYLEIGHF